MSNNFNLGLVVEHVVSTKDMPYSFTKNGLLRSLEVEKFIPDIANLHPNTYVINILEDYINSDGTITVYKASDDSKVKLPLSSLDVIYFGNTGQKMYVQPNYNSLISNLETLCSFFDVLKAYPSISTSNPVETMLKFVSKDYLFDLQEAGIPVSKHSPIKRVDSFQDFEELKKVSNNQNIEYIVKPLIAERGNGSKVLSEISDDKMKQMLLDVKNKLSSLDDSTYGSVMSRQGFIAQPFNEDYIVHGEKKIFVVDGEITLARKNEFGVTNGQNYFGSLQFRNKLREKVYVPTIAEVEFVQKVSNYLKSKNIDFDYFRLDVVGNGTEKQTYLNELELFNPCSSAGHNVLNPMSGNPSYLQNVIDNHNKKLLTVFEKRFSSVLENQEVI